jgi:outer membrane protein OmpU
MKKLLFASTALVMSAGVAAADVSVGGDGRMGVTYDSDRATKFQFTNRIRISFSASGTADNGLTFGGSIRADNAVGGRDGTAGNVFISGAFGRIAMGDVNSGDKQVVGQLHGVGLTGLGDHNEVSYAADNGDLNGLGSDPAFTDTVTGLGLDGYTQIPARALYTYSMAGFDFAVSHSQTGPNKSAGIGVGYSMDGLSVGIGYGESRNNDIFDAGPGAPGSKARDLTAMAAYDFGDFDVKALYQDKKMTVGGGFGTFARHRSLGASVGASFDELGMTAYVIRKRQTTPGGAGNVTLTSAGLGASWDLGGGASLVGGVARVQEFDLSVPNLKSSKTVADFGVSLRF